MPGLLNPFAAVQPQLIAKDKPPPPTRGEESLKRGVSRRRVCDLVDGWNDDDGDG